MLAALKSLPPAPIDLGPSHTRQWRNSCGAEYQLACLEYAQSLWLRGKPAQAILQINKSLIADARLSNQFCPYAALAEILRCASADHFLGNPVRHFQHLATRMAGPRSSLRALQAWACFHISKAQLLADAYPVDQEQITRESLQIPSLDTVLAQLPNDDQQRVRSVLRSSL